MRALAAVFGLCLLLAHGAVRAQAPDDPLFWLDRITSASQRLNYVGTLVYHSGKEIETLRIAHSVGADGEHERLEVLDGDPREIIRAGAEIRCVLPGQKTVLMDRAGNGRAFQVRVPTSVSALTGNYRIEKGVTGRVAGRAAQSIVLEPRDDLRYGYVLWADVETGLLLRSRMLDARGEPVEQIAFSDISIGGEVDRELLKTRYGHTADWRIVNARASETPQPETGWTVRTLLPGFSLVSTVRRPLGRNRGEMAHMVFSDGLSTISVFIEPLNGEAIQTGADLSGRGATSVYQRQIAGHLLVVLGEAPLRALQQLADGIGPPAP